MLSDPANVRPGEVTRLLTRWNDGDREAFDLLCTLVHSELRRLARNYMRNERPGHTLQATALVNEAYLRLVGQKVSWQNRKHFFGIAAQIMRRILMDHARRRHADKRNAIRDDTAVEELGDTLTWRREDIVAVDAALGRLARVAPRQCRIVEMKVFAGMTIEEMAVEIGVSATTVRREWNVARAWLQMELEPQGAPDGSEAS